MKVLILAGGLGTRLGEETSVRPKPMVGIGGYPILWHIMKIYSHYGFNDFVILTGYKQEVIKDYFVNFYMNNCDVEVNLRDNSTEIKTIRTEPWKVTLAYTGRNTLTGSRIKKAQKYVGNEPFLLTYGDGVSNVNIKDLIQFHNESKKICTLTAYQPEGRFGALDIDNDDLINKFNEKPKDSGNWVNSGFFVCEPEVFNYIGDGDEVTFEKEPLISLAKDQQLNAFKHFGFWHPMDMLKDKIDLNNLWASGTAPWKIWD